MQPFDHLTVHVDDVQFHRFRFCESGNNRACFRKRRLIRTEVPVGRFDLGRMDQHLAIEAHGAPLFAFGFESLDVAKIIRDAVNDIEPVGPRGKNHLHHPRHEIGAARKAWDMRFLAQIVEPDDESGKPGIRRMGSVGNRGSIQDTKRCLDHRPDFQMLGRIRLGEKIGHVMNIGGLFHLRQ